MLEQRDIAELWRRAKRGDGIALERLLSQYRPLIISLARRWQRCGFEDAVQEAHLAVIEAIHIFDPAAGCYFGVFLRQRIRARLRTWGRRQTRWTERNTVASHPHDGDSETVPIEEWADENSSREMTQLQWQEWLQDLSPRERLVIQRQLIDGYNLSEIAAQESVSRHTVHTWKKRALQKLRKIGTKNA